MKIRDIPVLAFIFLILSTSYLFYGCTLKAMTPAQKDAEVKALGNEVGLLIYTKHPEMIDVAKKYSDKVMMATTSDQIGNLYNLAYRFYLEKHPEDLVLAGLVKHGMILCGVQVVGIDVVPDSIDIDLAKKFVEGFRIGLDGLIST